MSDHGGLPAIPVYEIHRHWWLHEARRGRIIVKGGFDKGGKYIRKQAQRELCKIRKEHYGH